MLLLKRVALVVATTILVLTAPESLVCVTRTAPPPRAITEVATAVPQQQLPTTDRPR